MDIYDILCLRFFKGLCQWTRKNDRLSWVKEAQWELTTRDRRCSGAAQQQSVGLEGGWAGLHSSPHKPPAAAVTGTPFLERPLKQAHSFMGN